MHNFFVNENQKQNNRFFINGTDFNHIKNVLRMNIGDTFLISENGASNLCEIESFESDTVIVKILQENYNDTSLPIKIYLFQGLPKSDKMELIIQKAVELGASRIVPVEMKRSVVKLDAKKAQAKISRWQGIAEAAAKQSKRDVIPVIGELTTLKEALKEAADFEVSMMPYENAEGMAFTRKLLEGIQPGQRVAIFVGPEGGFDESEVEAALSMGTKPMTLGRRILRTETAGLAILSMLVYVLEV